MSKTWILSLIVLTIFINFILIFSPFLINDDPTVYFTLAKNMVVSHNWLFLTDSHGPWLDKPHFPFWLTAISFKLFGFHPWSYILPGFIFYMMGAIYTYKLAQLFYTDKMVALLSVLIYVTTLRLMLSSLDVRAEAYLVGEIMPACYYWLKYNAETKIRYLILGALFTAFGMMTKGIFVLVTIGSGIMALWIYQHQYRNFIRFKWIIALTLSFLFTLPEFIALYVQFGKEGIEWFFWGSQFGRFLGTGRITHAHGSVFFFFFTFFWAFLPWALIFIAVLCRSIKNFTLFSSNNKNAFVFLASSFFITFLMFSISKFQLDYYTNIIFPFATILCARYLYDTTQKNPAHSLFKIQLILSGILLVLVIILIFFTTSKGSPYFITTALLPIILLFSMMFFKRKKSLPNRAILYSVLNINCIFLTLLLIQLFINAPLSAGYTIGNYLNKQKNILPVYEYQTCSNLTIYIPQTCAIINDLHKMPNSSYYLIADSQSVPSIIKILPKAQIVLKKNDMSTNSFIRHIFSQTKKFDMTQNSITLLEIT